MKYCAVTNLTDKNKVDRDRLNKALDDNDGYGIYAATEACQRNVGDIKKWERDSAGCNDADFLKIGKDAQSSGWKCGLRVRYYCYTQNKNWVLDDLQCTGQHAAGAACTCNIYGQQSPGTVVEEKL
jgi:hypothetical protein